MRPNAALSAFAALRNSDRVVKNSLLSFGGRIDEPSAACGSRVQRDNVLIGGAQFAIGKIGDANLEVGKAAGLIGSEAGGCPNPYGLLQNLSDALFGQRVRSRGRASQTIVVYIANQQELNGRSLSFICAG